MVASAKTNGDKPSAKFNLAGLKLVGATIFACLAVSYPLLKWTRTPGSGLIEGTGQSPATGFPVPYPQGEVHGMMLRGDADALKKVINDAGDQRTEWCLSMLESAITAKGDVSLDFVLDGLEEQIGSNESRHRQRFDTIVRSINFMPPQVQADMLLHVKSFSSDPKKIADVKFSNRTILDHKALREAVIKVCANKMPEALMRELLWQCESPYDWQLLCELFKDQDKRTRSALISQSAMGTEAIWRSNSLTSIFNLCDEQALNEIADYCVNCQKNDPLEILIACGAKVSLQPGESSLIAKSHPKAWKAMVATMTQEDLEQLWWDGIQNLQLDELKLWEEKLQLVIDVPKRISNDYGVTALEHLVVNPGRWETCEWLIQHKAKTPNSAKIETKLFLAVAQNQQHRLKSLIASDSFKELRLTPSNNSRHNDQQFSTFGRDLPRALLHSAIRMGHAEACGILTAAFAKLGPNDSVLYAIERKQWACIQEMLSNGHELQSDEIRKINEKAPGGLAGIIGDVNREISPKSVSILIESAIERTDEAALAIAMKKARELSEKARDGKGLVSLEEMFGKDETKRLVGLAISYPRSLAILQFHGFGIDFDHLLNAVRDVDVQAVEVCLRSSMMMNMSESDRRQLKEEMDQSQSSEIRELIEELGW